MSDTERQMREDPLDAAEAKEQDVSDRLRHERPNLSAGFRDDLRRRLLHTGPGPPDSRISPVRVIAAYSIVGAMLLVVATAGLAGLGPFAS